MNRVFKNVLLMLNITCAQALFPEIIETRVYHFEMPEEIKSIAIEAAPQIISSNTIIVDNSHYDCFIIALFEEKLEIYHMPADLPRFQEFKDIVDTVDKEEFIHYTNSESPVFYAPKIELKDGYIKSIQDFFINSAKSIMVDDCLIEVPNIILNTGMIELGSFFIGTQTIELQSNNPNSLLSKIKLTFKDKTDFIFPMLIEGDVDFDYNFVALCCVGVSNVEIQCLPGSFYIDGNKICFN
jgi:hypothetical protein